MRRDVFFGIVAVICSAILASGGLLSDRYKVVDVFNPDPRATTPRMTVMVDSLTGKTWAFEAQMKKDAPGFFFSEWSPLGYWMSPPYDVDDEQVTPFTERK